MSIQKFGGEGGIRGNNRGRINAFTIHVPKSEQVKHYFFGSGLYSRSIPARVTSHIIVYDVKRKQKNPP